MTKREKIKQQQLQKDGVNERFPDEKTNIGKKEQSEEGEIEGVDGGGDEADVTQGSNVGEGQGKTGGMSSGN